MNRNPKRFSPVPFEPHQLQVPEMTPPAFKESTLLKDLGITPKYVLHEYMKVVNQDEDLGAKLKAIKPLAKEIGLDLDGVPGQGITNNIIVMPQEIVSKYKLDLSNIPPTPLPQQPSTTNQTIDIPHTPPTIDIPPTPPQPMSEKLESLSLP
jgi:hypothetical protein